MEMERKTTGLRKHARLRVPNMEIQFLWKNTIVLGVSLMSCHALELIIPEQPCFIVLATWLSNSSICRQVTCPSASTAIDKLQHLWPEPWYSNQTRSIFITSIWRCSSPVEQKIIQEMGKNDVKNVWKVRRRYKKCPKIIQDIHT